MAETTRTSSLLRWARKLNLFPVPAPFLSLGVTQVVAKVKTTTIIDATFSSPGTYLKCVYRPSAMQAYSRSCC
ncbi:hypothetical protein P692DRAFT_20831234 [Suillus brevipes Sb2]|nr:hypothetical protein P692DRAFT_20831234 [Suillus brevipes Sb2]